MEYIASGAQADIYKDGSKAVKIFKNNERKINIEQEANLQKLAFDYGLPVPEIFYVIEVDDKFGIVMEYIEGTPLGKVLTEDNSKIEEYFIKSIEIQNNIHKIETGKFPSMKDKLKNHIISANELTDIEKARTLVKLEKATFDNKLCHGDFHVFNLILTPNGIKIIDWVCESTGNPDADIYRTYLLYKLYKEDIADIYLEMYCKIYNLNKSRILSWGSIIAGARLGEYTKDEREVKLLKEIVRNEKEFSQKVDLYERA